MSENRRTANEALIHKYFATGGEERLALFTEDGVKELGNVLNPDMPALRWEGKAMLRENFCGCAPIFYAWTWSKLDIYSTQNPDCFFIEAEGRGKQAVNGQESDYMNRYIFKFTFQEGYIKEVVEYFNPVLLMAAMGLDIPKMANPVENTGRIYRGEESLEN